MKYELEVTIGGIAPSELFEPSELNVNVFSQVLKQQIDELKMATREATVVTEGRQRLAHELHLIEDNIREKERQLRLTQRKRRNVSSLPLVNGKTTIDWDIQFFNSFDQDEEDNGIASGMRELELRLQHELEDQE